jgi:hypothetical protein
MQAILDRAAIGIILYSDVARAPRLGRLLNQALAAFVALAVGKPVKAESLSACCSGPYGSGLCSGDPSFYCWPAYNFCFNAWSSCWCSTTCSWTSCCDEYCAGTEGYCVDEVGIDPLHCGA